MLDNEEYHITNGNIQFGSMSGSYDNQGTSSSLGIPTTPKGGAIVRVTHIGVGHPESCWKRNGSRPHFSGVEMSGIVHDLCNTIPNCNFTIGDRVILYYDSKMDNSGFKEFIAVNNVENIVQLPSHMSSDVASMMAGSALTAYTAIMKAKPHIEKLQKIKSCVNVLIVGAGGLGLWAERFALSLIGPNTNTMRLFMADNSVDKLLTARAHGCYDIIHWNEQDHEEYLHERTLNGCCGGVDVVIDFVSSARTVKRALKVLNTEGLILVGGDAIAEVRINLNSLAAKNQSIVGLPQGSLSELRDLMDIIEERKISPPQFSVFPMEQVNQVFDDLSRCQITGRAVLHYGNTSSNAK